jgi:uncharacterized protein (DUF2236 family)
MDPPIEGYFEPDSAVRRIGSESVLMLGGGRALLMQAAHPLVAAGIVGHSGYGHEPWRRLARTMTALYTIVFGTCEEADRAGEIVRAVHARVYGRLEGPVGPFPAGTPYSASDPELMLWVHATLVDTGFVMYETYVGPLAPADAEGFYRDMRVVASVFGVPDGVVPPTLAGFRDYLRAQLAGPELVVGAAARSIADTVLRPPVPLPLRPTLRALARTSVGLLPPELRERYGFRWTWPEAAALAVSARGVRAVVLPTLPGRLRTLWPNGVPLAVLSAFAH